MVLQSDTSAVTSRVVHTPPLRQRTGVLQHATDLFKQVKAFRFWDVWIKHFPKKVLFMQVWKTKTKHPKDEIFYSTCKQIVACYGPSPCGTAARGLCRTSAVREQYRGHSAASIRGYKLPATLSRMSLADSTSPTLLKRLRSSSWLMLWGR